MSHYPLPPPLGGHFAPNTHFTPSPSVHYPPLPHLPYQQVQDTQNQSQGQPIGLASTNYANSYGFNNNQSSVRAGMPQSPYPGYGQTMNCSFPLPFPPVPPIPYGVPSPNNPSLFRHDTDSASIPLHPSLPVKPRSASALGVDAVPENPQIPISAASELEDGELSDEGERSRSKIPGVGSPKDSGDFVKAQEEVSSRSSSNDGRGIFQAPTTIRSGFSEGDHSPPELQPKFLPNESSHEFSPRKTAINGVESSKLRGHTTSARVSNDKPTSGTVKPLPPFLDSGSAEDQETIKEPDQKVTGPVQNTSISTYQYQTASDRAHQAVSSANQVTSRATLESPNDIRERAKNVLRELYPHEIGFAKLVEEGINPRILYELYAEIGIQIRSPMHASQMINDTHLSSMRKADKTPVRTNVERVVRDQPQWQNQREGVREESPKNHQQLLQTPQISTDSLNGQKISLQQPPTSKSSSEPEPTAKDKSPKAQTYAAASAQNLVPVSKLNATVKAHKPPNANLLGRPTGVQSGDKALERKDYIARMLAAKASKPIPAVSTIVSTDAVVDYTQGGNVQTARSKEEKITSAIEERPTEILGDISAPRENEILLREGSVQSAHIKQSEKLESSIPSSQRVEMDVSSTTKNRADAESNKMAQTQLARQKMEALKSRDSNQSENQNSHDTTISIQTQHSPPSQIHHEPQQDRGAMLQSADSSYRVPQGPNPVLSNIKPTSIIPGLFMASSTQGLVTSSSTPTSQNLAPTIRAQNDVSFSSQTSDRISHFEPYPSQKAEVKEPLGSSTSPKTPVADVRPTTSKAITVNDHRKRQKAADFIDSPSTRVKRTLGQNEDTSVIIEISEEEDNQESEEGEVDMDVDMETDVDEGVVQSTQLKDSSGPKNESAKPKSIRDLPPLSDFQSKRRITPSIAAMTPPAAHTPSKYKEPEDLKLKEKEIELMNRKIAELEQRLKAKQTASRGQTPEKSTLVKNFPKILGDPAGPQESLKVGVLGVESSQEPIIETEPPILGTTDNSVNQVENIQASQGSEPIQNVDAVQEAEASEATVTREANIFPEARAAKEAKAIQEVKAGQTFELAEKTEVTKDANVAGHEQFLAEQRIKVLEQTKTEIKQATDVTTISEEEKRRLRRSEIEFGLPLLDAEVERTKQKLQSLKKQMEGLESEVQKGIEGRRILMEELIGLTSRPISVELNGEQTQKVNPDLQVLNANEGQQRYSALDQISDPTQNQPKTNGQEKSLENSSFSTSAPLPSRVVEQNSGNSISDYGQREKNMDIDNSRTNVDEGEITNYSPEPPANFSRIEASANSERTHEQHIKVGDNLNEMTGQADDDFYEPPAIIDAGRSGGDERVGTQLSEKKSLELSNNLPLPRDLKPFETHVANGSAQVEVEGPDRSLPLTDVSDSDDYEPPEPTSPVEPADLQSNGKILTHSSVLPNPSDEVNDASKHDTLGLRPHSQSTDLKPAAATIDLNQANDLKNTLNSEKGQYTPYESPLKQFKSYRFHPRYLSEVPRGFRSLTYSHGINPDKPLCRYEVAGGVCNDDSCEGQHIRSLALSDNMILVQMGAIPEGLNQKEGDAYATGLRQIIQEIRGRKVTDFNVVASEIAAYRAKFLGETVKGLPL